jgi:flagellar hook protein FlgE
MKYLKYYNSAILESSLDEDVDKKEIKAKNDAKNKELEEKIPELKTIGEEALKFGKENLETDDFKKTEEFMDKLENTEGFKEAMVVLRDLVKELGIFKSLKMIKKIISNMTTMIQTMKKVRNILPEGEKYNLCFTEKTCEIVTGGDNEDNVVEETIDKIKKALTVKNLMSILTGKTDELEIEYMTKDGKEAEGEIKNVEIKDDGSIEVSIENDKVGTIKKDLTEITGAGDDVEGSEDDLTKKLAEVKAKRPDDITKISTFADFISNDTNKDNADKIYKIMGI